MPKYKTLVDFSSKNLGPEEIAAYFADTDAALRSFYTRRTARKFFGYRSDEVDAELELRIDELDATCCLSALADLEATFRIDYLKRCYTKQKDPLSRAFRRIYRNRGSSVSLEQDIFTTWKSIHPEFKQLIGAIDGAFNFRDWLAHGRYWKPALGRKYDFLIIYQIGSEARQSIPFMSI